MEDVKDHTYYEQLEGNEDADLVSFTDLQVEGDYVTFKNEYKVYLWEYGIITTRLFRKNWSGEATLKYKINTETLINHYIHKSINIKIDNHKQKIYISKILIKSKNNVLEKYDKTLMQWKDGKLSRLFIPILL